MALEWTEALTKIGPEGFPMRSMNARARTSVKCNSRSNPSSWARSIYGIVSTSAFGTPLVPLTKCWVYEVWIEITESGIVVTLYVVHV